MSLSKKDHTFPAFCDLKSDTEFAIIIAAALRSEYGNSSAAIKRIARDTSVSPRTARNWYEGKNLISARYLIILSRHCQTIRDLVTELVQPSATAHFKLVGAGPYAKDQPSAAGTTASIENVPVNVPVKFLPGDLNERQEWFLNQLSQNVRIAVSDIASAWHVDPKTAKRDISDLKARGIVGRIGSDKSGRYILIDLHTPQAHPRPK